MKTTLLLADDHNIFREALVGLLSKQPLLEVLGQAENGQAVVRLAQELHPQLVLMDICMPELNGIEATRLIKANNPLIKVLALSGFADQQYVSDALKAGATGYMLKTCVMDDLARAIPAVMQNQIYLSPAITHLVIEQYVNTSNDTRDALCPELSTREKEVLQLLTEGRSTKQIASKLNVSIKTIATHREHIMKKLDLHSIAELTRYALKEGLSSF
jgi:DNA-binding NarL/FixJ family response regulator